MRPARVLLLAALAFLAAPSARGDDQQVVAEFNLPSKAIKDSSKSWKPVFDAYLAMTPAPAVKGGLRATAIWPGMPEWDAVKAWAASNPKMGEALLAAQRLVAFAMPYGRGSVPPPFVERGIFIGIGDGTSVYFADPAYLKPLGVIQAYVAAEMYRLGQEKRFDDAFGLGLACMRVLRQVADQHLLSEKTAAMQGLGEMASVQRDVLQTFLDEVPAAVVSKYAREGYAQVRPSDGERLRRLDMPEGDRVLAEALILQVFDAQGQPDGERFVEAMTQFQSRREPLSAFGATRRWEQIAGVHASLDATRARLTRIYDDWWRRWRSGYADSLSDKPTVVSKTNPMKYAMVVAMSTDLARLFALRQWLNAELNGTVVAFAAAAYYRSSGSWPPGMENTYATSMDKRFDYDPWAPARRKFTVAPLSGPSTVEFEGAQVPVSGVLVFALGADGQNGGGKKASADGLTGDFVVWPALRAVSRGATTK
jgi:hypothetical protein